jgi:hypothetical protein
MNERIRELLDSIDVNPKIRKLAEQSGCSIDRLGFGEGHLEKFAELIVKECADAIVNDSRLNDVRSAANGCVRTIKQHFGVEE